jgi:3-hydroxyacyl-CoA dehydrogenase
MGKVAVVGTGFIGRAWAISFARAGHDVALWDSQQDAPARALDYIEALLPDLAANGLLNGEGADAVRGRMRAATMLEEALSGAAYIQENTPEILETKRAVFARLDAAAPSDCILASSTSSLLPSAFTESLAGRNRCLVVHPINPPYLIPAAEVVPAPWTDPGVVERTAALQGALLEEAFRLVAHGYASAEDVDIGLRDGLALRWSFMGPFETIDLNAPAGVRDYVERYGPVYRRIDDSALAHPDWNGPVLDRIETERRSHLAAQDLAKRQAWRDRRLMALAAHKRRAAKEIGS